MEGLLSPWITSGRAGSAHTAQITSQHGALLLPLYSGCNVRLSHAHLGWTSLVITITIFPFLLFITVNPSDVNKDGFKLGNICCNSLQVDMFAYHFQARR